MESTSTLIQLPNNQLPRIQYLPLTKIWCKMLEFGLFFCFGFGVGWEKVESLDNG
jgi:hypothetical protein